MHTVPRYEQVSHIAVCAHDDFIPLGAACCDQDHHVAVQCEVTGAGAVCGVCGKCGLLQEPRRHFAPCIRLLRKYWPETAKTRPTMVYTLRDAQHILYPGVLYFPNVKRCQAALRADWISPTSIKEMGIH